MGVYLPDMEMPTKQVCVILNPNGLVEVLDENNVLLEEYQAVPVPSHGRLGDLDELAKKIEHDRYNHTHTDGLAARHHIAEYGHFLKEIATAPTIIPAETALENEIKIIDTKAKPNYDPKHRFVILKEGGE